MSKKRSFTVIELMIAVTIVASLANIAIVSVVRSRRNAESAVCLENRRLIQEAETMYFSDNSQHSNNFKQLVKAGYLTELPICPLGGTYTWQSYKKKDPRYKTIVGCSVHGVSEVEAAGLEKKK